jgi:hypothetical protein
VICKPRTTALTLDQEWRTKIAAVIKGNAVIDSSANIAAPLLGWKPIHHDSFASFVCADARSKPSRQM